MISLHGFARMPGDAALGMSRTAVHKSLLHLPVTRTRRLQGWYSKYTVCDNPESKGFPQPYHCSHTTECASRICIDASVYTVAETLRSVFRILQDRGIRLRVAQVLDDVRSGDRYELGQTFRGNAFYDTPTDVLKNCRQRTDTPVR